MTQISFATPQDGYAFGPTLFVTTNGAKSWLKESGPPIATIEAADGNVVRVTSTGLVQSAPAGSDTWKTLPAPHLAGIQLVRSGPNILYALGGPPKGGGSYPGELWRSTDAGAAWQMLADPCDTRQYGIASDMAASGTSVSLVCTSFQIAPQQAGYQQGTVLSTDLGSSFGKIRPLPHLHGIDGGSGPITLAMASPSTLAVADSEGGLQSSFDGGVSWTTTIPQPVQGSQYPDSFTFAGVDSVIGFETATEGHAVTKSRIWTTTDGGRHWLAYQLPGT